MAADPKPTPKRTSQTTRSKAAPRAVAHATVEALPQGLTTGFMHRVLFVMLAVAMAWLALKLFGLWLLIFGAVIIAVILRGISGPLIRYLKLNETLAVVLALVGVLALISLTMYLFGVQIVIQVETLTKELPAAWAAFQSRLHAMPMGDEIQAQFNALGQQAGGFASKLPGIAGNILSSLANILVATIAGVMLAMHPGKYRDGLISLFPQNQRPALLESMNTSGEALKKWFIAQFISMVLVGVLVGVGLAIIGVPSALALGLMAGLAQFVPVVGPVLSAGPGLLLAGVGGTEPFLWTLALYVGVSQLESNLLTPMVQRQISEVPMVLTLFAIVGFAGLLGPMGVLYAMPITVILFSLIKRYLDLREAGVAPKNVE